LKQAGIWEWDGDCRFLFASEASARYAGGGWLEEWAWLTLAGLQADGLIPDGHWGTNLRVDAGHGLQEAASNELDAALVWRNQMGETWLLTARRLQQGTGSAARERARAYRIRLIEPAQLVDLRAEICAWMDIDIAA
jgi:hypothetical protein